MENQPVFEKSMANSLEIHGIRGKNKRIHGIFTDGLNFKFCPFIRHDIS